ncbi:MAG: hypothetical protein RLY43_102 [Bacteroidota bacterium]|jgi:hypothetical protein
MSYRKLIVGNKAFEYSVGKGVKIKSKGMKSIWVSANEVLGMGEFEYRCKCKDDDDGHLSRRVPICPQDIKSYLIMKGLINE